jgi:SEC-C motif
MALPQAAVTVNELLKTATDICSIRPVSIDELTAALNKTLSQRLPQPLDEDVVEEILEDEPDFFHLHDERLITQSGLWDGVVFTHRLLAEEIESGVVEVGVDFLELSSLARERSFVLDVAVDQPIVGTTGWTQESSRFGAAESFFGEAGWLAHLLPGDLVGIRMGRACDEWIGKIDDTDIDEVMGRRVADAFDDATADISDAPVEFGEIMFGHVVEVLADRLDSDNGEQYRAVTLPPLTETLTSVGLTVFDTDWTAPVSFDFDRWELARLRRIEEQRSPGADELSDSSQANLDRLFHIDDLTAANGPSAADSKAEARQFDDAVFRRKTIAQAATLEASELRLLDEKLTTLSSAGRPRDKALIQMVRAQIVRAVDPSTSNSATTARIDELLGDARTADRRCLEVLDESAWEAFRVGDFPAARSWIREWGRSGGVNVEALERGEPLGLQAHLLMDIDACIGKVSVAHAADVPGRNEPCHCGSGRKFKQCCINKPSVSVSAGRGPLLHCAMGWFVHRTRPDEIAELASMIGGEVPSVDALTVAIDALTCDPAVVNEFLEEMDFSGGTADWAMVKAWASITIGLWEVEHTRPGHSLSIRNVRDGVAHNIVSDHMSSVLSAGMYIATRPIPMTVDVDGTISAQSEWRIFSGCSEVPMQWRDSFLELLDDDPSPRQTLMWLRLEALRGQGRPTLRNTDGDEMLYSTRRWTLTSDFDPTRVRTTLDSLVRDDTLIDDSGDLALVHTSVVDPFGWTILESGSQQNMVTGQIQASGDEVELTTNSLSRLLRLSDWLTELVDLGDEFTTTFETLDDRALAEDLGLRGRPMPIEMARVSDEDRDAIEKQMERNWLGSAIPALGGLTPRQAAADPTRVADLRRLLDDFDVQAGIPGAISFNVNRLRRELGLLFLPGLG